MHTIYIHIDEDLGETGMQSLQNELRGIGHVTDVEINEKTPHDILVEFEENYVSPMAILREIKRHGVHADIMSG